MGSNDSLVSVIIPAYNYGKYLGQTISHVQKQSYKNWECVIVDDGSTDQTKEVAQAFAALDRRVKYVYQQNQGVSAARNHGIRMSVGEFVQFLDADDLIETEKLAADVAYLRNNPDCAVVYNNSRFFTGGGSVAQDAIIIGDEIEWVPRSSGTGRDILESIITVPFPPHAPLLRRSVIEKVGLFNESFGGCADWHFWIRCAAAGHKFQYLDEPNTCALYRQHTDSMSKDLDYMTGERRRVRSEIKKIISDPEILLLNRRLSASFEGYLGIEAVKRDELFKGIWLFLRAAAITRSLKEKAKWTYTAMLAPLAPKEQIEQVVTQPARYSLKMIVRGVHNQNNRRAEK